MYTFILNKYIFVLENCTSGITERIEDISNIIFIFLCSCEALAHKAYESRANIEVNGR